MSELVPIAMVKIELVVVLGDKDDSAKELLAVFAGDDGESTKEFIVFSGKDNGREIATEESVTGVLKEEYGSAEEGEAKGSELYA